MICFFHFLLWGYQFKYKIIAHNYLELIWKPLHYSPWYLSCFILTHERLLVLWELFSIILQIGWDSMYKRKLNPRRHLLIIHLCFKHKPAWILAQHNICWERSHPCQTEVGIGNNAKFLFLKKIFMEIYFIYHESHHLSGEFSDSMWLNGTIQWFLIEFYKMV